MSKYVEMEADVTLNMDFSCGTDEKTENQEGKKEDEK